MRRRPEEQTGYFISMDEARRLGLVKPEDELAQIQARIELLVAEGKVPFAYGEGPYDWLVDILK